MLRLWHNPRCSKSRAALALLTEHGAEFETLRYLETPPDPAALDAILSKLDLPAAELARRGEAVWKENGLTQDSPEDAIRALILANPILIERPVAISGGKAVIGRPSENLLTLL